MSSLSKSGVQFWPPSVVFQTPPATPPKYHVSGSPGTPSIASARPPRNGPICRHCIPLKSFSSIAPGGVGFGVAVGDFVGDGVCPPSFGGGLTAEVVKQTKASAAENRERKIDEIIRLRWKACRAVQLESRMIGLGIC